MKTKHRNSERSILIIQRKKANPCTYCRNWQEIIKHNILWTMLKFHSNSSHLDYLLSIERRYMGIWVWSTDFPFPGRVGVLYKYLFNCKTYASLYVYIPKKQRNTFSKILLEILFLHLNVYLFFSNLVNHLFFQVYVKIKVKVYCLSDLKIIFICLRVKYQAGGRNNNKNR